MADPHGPPPEMYLKAYELHLAGKTQTQIAAELGIAQSTASGYIKRGRAAFQLYAAIEQQEDQDDSALRLHSWVGRLEALWDEAKTIAEACALARELRALEQRRATLRGFDAAAKLQVSHTVEKDAELFANDATLAAVREMIRRNKWDEDEVRAGRPGMVKPREEWTG